MISLARPSTLFVICLTACASSDDISDTLVTLTTSHNDDGTSGDGDPTSDGDPMGDGDGDSPGDGDGDGDPGDGDPGDGDGDGDPGDGDPGDGDPGDGDGDGDASSCMLYAQKLADCSILDYRTNLAQCSTIFGSFVEDGDPGCMAAWDAFILCNLGGTCEELQDQLCLDAAEDVFAC